MRSFRTILREKKKLPTNVNFRLPLIRRQSMVMINEASQFDGCKSPTRQRFTRPSQNGSLVEYLDCHLSLSSFVLYTVEPAANER